MASEIQEGDIGTTLLVTVTDDGSVVDISAASALSIFIRQPDGTLLSRTGVLYTDGTDGKMYYVAIAGDLDEAGSYKIQGQVVVAAGTFNTSTATFKVHCNI